MYRCNGGTAGADAQFAEDVFKVEFDRIFRQVQSTGNLLVGAPPAHFIQNILFALTESAIARSFTAQDFQYLLQLKGVLLPVYSGDHLN